MFYISKNNSSPTCSSVIVSFEIPSEYTKAQYIEKLFARELATKKDDNGNYKKKRLWGWSKDKDFEATDVSTQNAFRSVLEFSGNGIENLSPSFKFLWCGTQNTDVETLENRFCLLRLQEAAQNMLFHQFYIGRPARKNKTIITTDDIDENESNCTIEDIYLALFNHRQGVLVFHLKHDKRMTEESYYNVASSLKLLKSLCYLHKERDARRKSSTPKQQKTSFGLGVLDGCLEPRDYNLSGVELKPVSFELLINWLVSEQAHVDAPKDVTSKNSLLYRQHHVFLEKQPSDEEKQRILFYLSKARRLKEAVFVEYQQNSEFEIIYHKGFNHLLQITRESTVSIMWPSSASPPHEERNWGQRFLTKYQLLLLQVIGEYLCISELAFQGGAYAYKDKIKEEELESLMRNMNYFQLGVSIGDCGGNADAVQFYNTCRSAFDLRRLSLDLKQKVKDVYYLIGSKYQKQTQAMRETERKRREEEKEATEKRYRDEQSRLEHERLQTQDRYQEEKDNQERKERKRQRLFAVLGSLTVPFAIGSGMMGMNNSRKECSPLSEQWSYLWAGPSETAGVMQQGRVPCVTFLEFVLICLACSVLIFVFSWFFLLRDRKQPAN